jgi:predicted O-methyltransferase YrrM
MTDDWEAVDTYLADVLIGRDDVLTDALATNADAGLPAIDVAPVQGKFLNLLARMVTARRVLEIGTLGGYSTVWLARAVGETGSVVTLEVDPAHAAVARTNLDRAGVGDRVQIVVGPALTTLSKVRTDDDTSFDLVFIDADKVNNAQYVEWAIVLGRPGTVIVVDNVIRGGSVVDEDSTDGGVQGARTVLDLLASHPHLDATALQTVGLKGWDGFALALVVE